MEGRRRKKKERESCSSEKALRNSGHAGVYLSSRSDEVGGREMEDKSGIEKEREVKRVPHADVENRCGTGSGSVLKNEFKLNDACTEHLAPETFAENYMRCAYTSCLTRLDAHLRVCSARFFPLLLFLVPSSPFPCSRMRKNQNARTLGSI